ncbi:hypothetical protein [Pseudotenacibaculum haliotis]|uniref:Zinc ribbon domain-containing protein n=1 Tax=Pseudotenacibaculum haliotis TaxID=1862138 RepID=A0ABW5LPY6_9FLAO
MLKKSSYIKCSQCGVFTSNADYCENCGELISYVKKVELKEEKQKQQRIEKARWEMQNPNWVERLKKHPFIPYRIVGLLLYSAFVIVSAIGAAVAWFLAMVAAG